MPIRRCNNCLKKLHRREGDICDNCKVGILTNINKNMINFKLEDEAPETTGGDEGTTGGETPEVTPEEEKTEEEETSA